GPYERKRNADQSLRRRHDSHRRRHPPRPRGARWARRDRDRDRNRAVRPKRGGLGRTRDAAPRGAADGSAARPRDCHGLPPLDAQIVMIEACHKKLERAAPDLSKSERAKLLREAAKEVTPAIFFSLLIIAISFVPVFGLNGQAGRLFRPLAYTKTFVMLSAAV